MAQLLTELRFFPASLLALILISLIALDQVDGQDSPSPQPSPSLILPSQSAQAAVQGVVYQYLMNPDGIVDGLLLTNYILIRFPPHLGQVLVQTVAPGDTVRVEGSTESQGAVHASAIVDLQSHRSVLDIPPSRKHPRPRPAKTLRQPMNAMGVIRILMHSPQGDVNGAVLTDGTIIHFPVSIGRQFSALLREGQTLAVSGSGVKNDYGRSLEAIAIGPSLDTLQNLGPADHP